MISNEQVRSASEKDGFRMDNFEDPCVTPGLVLEKEADTLLERIVTDRKGAKPSSVDDLSKFFYRHAKSSLRDYLILLVS